MITAEANIVLYNEGAIIWKLTDEWANFRSACKTELY